MFRAPVDLSHTVSESLGDFSRKWGIPAIPRPKKNTAITYILCSKSGRSANGLWDDLSWTQLSPPLDPQDIYSAYVI